MLPDFFVAGFSVVLVAALAIINLKNIFGMKRSRQPTKPSSTSPSEGSYVYLAAFGTLVFGADSLLLPFITFTGFFSFLNAFPLRLAFAYDSVVQILGLIILVSGYVLFSWSVIARGRYAVSWDMPEDHKLVTWGSYHYVRHPSYLAYFLMFIGLLLAWLNLLAVPTLVAVPGYYYVTENEEKILIERFGDEYRRYQEKTGRFFPRIRKT